MNPIEKAKELVGKFRVVSEARFTELEQARQDAKMKVCALICVDEILASSDHAGGWDDYWIQVKEEIKKL